MTRPHTSSVCAHICAKPTLALCCTVATTAGGAGQNFEGAARQMRSQLRRAHRQEKMTCAACARL